MRNVLIGLVAIAGSAIAQDGASADKAADGVLHPRVTMKTTLGDITLELDGEKAPVTVENFMHYVQDDFYDGLIFHRVVSDFMIQGGGFTPEMDEKEKGLRSPIMNEWDNGLTNERGTIAMARTNAPNSATAQFFINVVNNDRLSQPISGGAGYAVFGKVVDGMDVVDKIRETEVTENPKLPMGKVVPAEPVIISDITVAGDWSVDKFKEAVSNAARRYWPDEVLNWVRTKETELGKKITVDTAGVGWFVLKEGDGPTPTPTSKVPTHYTGTFLDGKQFDSSSGKSPYPVDMRGGVIQGWLDVLATMKAGEKRLVLIPPKLAYGKRGRPGIPGDSWLVFEMEVVSISN